MDASELRCFTNGTDVVSARDVEDAKDVLREVYGEDTQATERLEPVPNDRRISVWQDDVGPWSADCCLTMAMVSEEDRPLRGGGHHRRCDRAHPEKRAIEWARQGRGLICSSEA